MLTPDRVYTYGEVYGAADRVGIWLRENSITRGERIILIADNSFFWCAIYLGAMQAGVVVIPLMPGMEGESFRQIAADTTPRALFIQESLRAYFAPFIPDRLQVVTETGQEAQESIDRNRISTVSVQRPVGGKDDLASIIFTSGSSGRQRGVMISHRNLCANTSSIVKYLALAPTDRIMAVLPFPYCFGASLLHTHLAVGASTVVGFPFMFPDQVLAAINKLACTGFAGVPSHYQILLRHSSLAEMSFPTLRMVQQAGGRLPASDLLELQKQLPNTRIFVMYGQTEATARLSYLDPSKLTRKPGSVGQAIPGVHLSLEDEQGRAVGPGEWGEIVASGDNITQGYWRDEEETAQCFRGGRLHTGDIARQDDEGDLFIVDRAKNFLKLAGYRVSTSSLEEKLRAFPGVRELTVVGLDDPDMGEAVKLCLVHSEGEMARKSLINFCQEILLTHEQPKEIVFLDALPKLASGKIDRRALRQMN